MDTQNSMMHDTRSRRDSSSDTGSDEEGQWLMVMRYDGENVLPMIEKLPQRYVRQRPIPVKIVAEKWDREKDFFFAVVFVLICITVGWMS